MANLLAQAGGAIIANPGLALGLGEVVGGLVSGGLDLFSSKQDREERKDRLEAETKKTTEFLEKEAKLSSEERKEVFGLEKERSKEMLDKELDYLGKLADKNIDLFNSYYNNLAKRRQELLAQGLTREEIPEFFNQVLASRQSIMAGATKVPDTYYQGASLGDLSSLRTARLQNFQNSITPLQQGALQQRVSSGSIPSSIRNLANVYLASQGRLGKPLGGGSRTGRGAVVDYSNPQNPENISIQEMRRQKAVLDKESREKLLRKQKEASARKIQKAFKKYKERKILGGEGGLSKKQKEKLKKQLEEQIQIAKPGKVEVVDIATGPGSLGESYGGYKSGPPSLASSSVDIRKSQFIARKKKSENVEERLNKLRKSGMMKGHEQMVGIQPEYRVQQLQGQRIIPH